MSSKTGRTKIQELLGQMDKVVKYRMDNLGAWIECFNENLSDQWEVVTDVEAITSLLSEVLAASHKMQETIRFLSRAIFPLIQRKYDLWLLSTGDFPDAKGIKFTLKTRREIGRLLCLMKDADGITVGSKIVVELDKGTIHLSDEEALVMLFEELTYCMYVVGSVAEVWREEIGEKSILRFAKLVGQFPNMS